MSPELLTAHLAETVFLPLDQIAERCRRWGLVAELGDGQLTLRRPPAAEQPFAGGLAERTDPINRAVVLGLVLVGELWPMAFPDLLLEVNRKWKELTTGRHVTYAFGAPAEDTSGTQQNH